MLTHTAIARVRRIRYRLPLPAQCASALHDRVTSILASSECWIERSKPRLRRINIRPCLQSISVLSDALEFDLLITPMHWHRASPARCWSCWVFGMHSMPAAWWNGAAWSCTMKTRKLDH